MCCAYKTSGLVALPAPSFLLYLDFFVIKLIIFENNELLGANAGRRMVVSRERTSRTAAIESISLIVERIKGSENN